MPIWPTIDDAIANSRHYVAAPLTWDPVEHLLSRFAFGASAADRAAVTAQGPAAWVQAQLDLAAAHPGYDAHPGIAAVGTLLNKTPFDVRQWLIARDEEYGWTAMDQLCQVTTGLQIWSPAQLFETVVDFFSNHLNVPNHDGDMWITRHAYDRDVIRAHALGTFTDMLLASSKHPAMLTYLSLAASTKAAVNENYGRELLELHTVGLHYSENDVRNAARALTGRTLDDNLHYLFDDYIHPTGPIKVLGFTNPNRDATQGEATGDALVRYLAGHQATARHLATKLCQRYVSDAPSATLVQAVAQAYLDNGTAIVPMIDTILRSSEFWQSRGKKMRRPSEFLAATVRVLDPPVTNWRKALLSLQWMTGYGGQVPLDWPAPNGYPDVAGAWQSAGDLVNLWNLNLGLAGGWYDGLPAPDLDAMYAGATTSGAAIIALTQRLTGIKFSPEHRAALQAFLGEPANTHVHQSTLQWLLGPLVALILDGPHHALR